MASLKNDRLRFRTQLGPVNLYDNQQAIGTCSEKAHAARMGGHCFNPINHQPEKILSHLRNKSHYIDTNGVHTSEFVQRKRRVSADLEYLKQSRFVQASIEQTPFPPTFYVPHTPDSTLRVNSLSVSRMFDTDGSRFNIVTHAPLPMDYLRSLWRKPSLSTSPSVPSYDVPFATPSVHRIVIPPKPSSMAGKSIAPKYKKPESHMYTQEDAVPEHSQDVSVILFGSPLESVKTTDTLSTGVRYPTNALFPSPNK